MSFSDYSTNPANNLSIGGQSVAEGSTAPGTINLAVRILMADGKELSNTVAGFNLASYAPLNAPSFTGQPKYSGRGAFLHHNSTGNASGRVFVQAVGSAVPSMANGDILIEY